MPALGSFSKPELIGTKFGMLTLWAVLPFKRCVVRCDCWNWKFVNSDNLFSGRTISCGCFRAAVAGRQSITHGKTNSPEYKNWSGMIDRCFNPLHKKYARYGGRGIVVCPEWRSSFEVFLKYMGERPTPLHSVDRYPDNNGNYEPGNVRWATAKEQARNTSTNRLITIGDRTLTVSQWAEEAGKDMRLVIERLNRGWEPRRAVFQEVA